MVRCYIKVKRQEEDEFKEREQCIEAGSVWQLEEINSSDLRGGENDEKTRRNITRRENFDEHFKEIDSHSYELLLAIPKVEKRLKVFEDARWLHEGHIIQVGSEVVVFADGAAKFWGVVRFMGKLPKSSGHWFGVELDKCFLGEGSSNGKFKGVEYFRCPQDAALFVTIGRLRQMPPGCVFSNIEGLQDFEFTAATNKYNQQTSPALSMDELVGLESSKEGNIAVGVEFINPVGRGNGMYKKLSRSDPVSNNECVYLRSAEEPVTSGNSSRQFSVQANSSEYPLDRPSEQVKGKVLVPRVEDIPLYCGRGRGIQGCPVRQISTSACVTESIVFALFLFFDYFDEALYSPSRVVNPGVMEEQTEQLRQQLVVEIVNPLRRDKFVSMDKIERFNSVFKYYLMAEKESYNPVEMLNKVFTDVLRLKHFISFNSGESYYVYEIKDIENIMDTAHTRNVQHLLQCAIRNGSHRLREIPEYLIISLSAAGGNVVYPSFTLETTDLVEHIGRICKICRLCAEIECYDCYRDDGSKTFADALFCRSCHKTLHSNITLSGHRRSRELNPELHVRGVASAEPCVDMELFAVICNPGADALRFIAYVCVGPCGYTVSGSDDNKWLVYDGMAGGGKAREGGRGDRDGGGGSREEAGGSNVSSGNGRVYIPEIIHCDEIDKHCSSDIQGALLRKKDFKDYPKTLQTMMTGMSVCFYRRVQRIVNTKNK